MNTINKEYFAVRKKQGLKAGIDLVRFVEGTNMQHRALGKSDWPIRVGIHTGPVIAGYSGGSFDVWGDTVNIAARMESSGDAGKVHISEMTRAFVDHSEKIVDRGMTDLNNIKFNAYLFHS